jgi:hypothetical protein
MNHVILRERLQSLERQLAMAASAPEWLRNSTFATDEIFGSFDHALGNSARDLNDEAEAIECLLDDAEGEEGADLVEDAWRRYLQLNRRSQALFAECLEFVGGLAIRTNKYEYEICQTADELIRSCAIETIGRSWNSLTVPAAPDALAKTMARMIRVRFPDWTLWTLPLTAYEYGHVAIEEEPRLSQFVRTRAAHQSQGKLAEMVRRAPQFEPAEPVEPADLEKLERALRTCARNAVRDWQGQIEDDPKLPAIVRRLGAESVARVVRAEARHWADRELALLETLVADAFATYTMGPAYSCAALLLRFLPTQQVNAVPDAERAHVVLRTLGVMSDEGGGAYDGVIELVTEGWARVTTGAGLPPAVDTARAKQLDALVVDVLVLFKSVLRTTGRFPHAHERDGWLAAQMLTTRWLKELERGEDKLSTDDVELTKLRDALNAAWHCRLQSFAEGAHVGDGSALRAAVAKIENAAQDVCGELIDSQRAKRARYLRSKRRGQPKAA